MSFCELQPLTLNTTHQCKYYSWFCVLMKNMFEANDGLIGMDWTCGVHTVSCLLSTFSRPLQGRSLTCVHSGLCSFTPVSVVTVIHFSILVQILNKDYTPVSGGLWRWKMVWNHGFYLCKRNIRMSSQPWVVKYFEFSGVKGVGCCPGNSTGLFWLALLVVAMSWSRGTAFNSSLVLQG